MVLGTMVCPSFVLGGDANTGSAGYVCLETELVDGESDFNAAMLAAFAVAALLGLPSFFAVVCPGAATLFLGGENDFNAAMPAAFAFAGPRASQWIAQLYSLCFQGYALLCCAFRVSSSFLCACCDAVLGCAFRWLWWVCLRR